MNSSEINKFEPEHRTIKNMALSSDIDDTLDKEQVDISVSCHPSGEYLDR